jgi:hypothetical protein
MNWNTQTTEQHYAVVRAAAQQVFWIPDSLHPLSVSAHGKAVEFMPVNGVADRNGYVVKQGTLGGGAGVEVARISTTEFTERCEPQYFTQ